MSISNQPIPLRISLNRDVLAQSAARFVTKELKFWFRVDLMNLKREIFLHVCHALSSRQSLEQSVTSWRKVDNDETSRTGISFHTLHISDQILRNVQPEGARLYVVVVWAKTVVSDTRCDRHKFFFTILLALRS